MRSPSQWYDDGSSLDRAGFMVSLDAPVWTDYGVETEHPVDRPSFDMHHPLELGILVTGRLRCHYSRWHRDIEPGDVWLCGSWERHGRSVLQPPYERATILVVPTFLRGLNLAGSPPLDWTTPFRVPPGQRPVVRGETREAMLAIAERVRERFRATTRPNMYECAWSLVHLLEALLLLQDGWHGQATVGPPLHPDHAAIGTAVDLVLSSRGLIRSQDAARECGLSRNVFARRFKHFTGLSLPEFCRRHRVRGAAEQLLRTTDPVKTVAQDWGFTDQSHLHRQFLLYYQCSPAQYRAEGSVASHAR
jgi:AraC-like DNA-binding protein